MAYIIVEPIQIINALTAENCLIMEKIRLLTERKKLEKGAIKT